MPLNKVTFSLCVPCCWCVLHTRVCSEHDMDHDPLVDAANLLTDIVGPDKLWHECQISDLLGKVEQQLVAARADTRLHTRLNNFKDVLGRPGLFKAVSLLSESLQESSGLGRVTANVRDLVNKSDDYNIQWCLRQWVQSSKNGTTRSFDDWIRHINIFFSTGLGIRVALKNDIEQVKVNITGVFK